MSNLHPEQRVDKNGKVVIRHVKNDATTESKRVDGVALQHSSIRLPQLDRYWEDAADNYGLLLEEKVWLEDYLKENSEYFTVATTTASVIADSMSPYVHDALKHKEGIQRDIEVRYGLDVYVGMNGEGYFTRAGDSTNGTVLSVAEFSDGNEYFAGNERYTSSDDIPNNHRKLKQMAKAWESCTEERQELIEAQEDYENIYNRWRTFSAQAN